MPEERADDLQRCSGSQQVSGGGVPEQIRALRADIFQAGALQRIDDDAGHGVAGRKGPIRRSCGQEDPVLRNPRTCLFDVGQNRIAGVLRQWQAHLSLRLAADTDQRVAPVNVFQPQRDNVARPQGEPGKKQQDRLVSHARTRCAIAACDHDRCLPAQ